jgi:hypothetical protein
MKKMLLTLALAPLLALSAAAQESRWEDLALGDRVEITFRSGSTIGGMLLAPRPKMESVDYAKESALILDVSLEYPGLSGTMTVPKRDVQSIRRLRIKIEPRPICDRPPTPKPSEEPSKPAAPKPVTSSPTPEPAPEAPADDAAVKAAEELKKAKEFYAKYPAPDWSPERRNAIRLKTYRGQRPTPAEREFEAGYSLWEKGRAAAEPRKD